MLTTRSMSSIFPEKVTDIIDWNLGTWNISLLEQHFWGIDRDWILQVPVGLPTSRDRYVWCHSKTGNFTVRSCYHMILSAKIREDSRLNGSNSGERRLNWKGLWSLHLPSKVKVFLWRACTDIIPVRAELVRRHIASNPYCFFCETQVETSSHLFFECDNFGSIWSSPPFNRDVQQIAASFAARFQFLWANLEREVFELACVVCWRFWDVRNQYIYGEDTYIPSDIIKWSIDFLANFRTANMVPSSIRGPAIASEWLPPAPG